MLREGGRGAGPNLDRRRVKDQGTNVPGTLTTLVRSPEAPSPLHEYKVQRRTE